MIGAGENWPAHAVLGATSDSRTGLRLKPAPGVQVLPGLNMVFLWLTAKSRCSDANSMPPNRLTIRPGGAFAKRRFAVQARRTCRNAINLACSAQIRTVYLS